MIRRPEPTMILARAAVALVAFAVPAGIAPAQPQAQTQTQAPQQTTATYDDWTLRCAVLAGPPVQKSCEIVQSTHVQGQTAVLTQIAVGGQRKGTPPRMVIQVPIDVWLPTGVKVLASDKDPGLSAIFKRCMPAACFADVDLRDDVLKRFRTATDAGKLQFKDANQKDLSLPISFKGFDAAYQALPKD
jgi:invasion protein IalB